jgi:hypothetical protein
MLFLKLRPAVQIILIIQAICMLMGTYTHVNWVVRYGFLYPDVPLYSRLFWDSLTFLDPLAALLLFLRPRAGILLVLVIICVDVFHNAFAGGMLFSFRQMRGQIGEGWSFGLNPYFLLQVIFFVFVLATFRMNWRATK